VHGSAVYKVSVTHSDEQGVYFARCNQNTLYFPDDSLGRCKTCKALIQQVQSNAYTSFYKDKFVGVCEKIYKY